MQDETRGIALVILGIIAIVAVIGLVLLFSGAKKSAGAVPTLMFQQGLCDSPCTMAFGASEAEVATQTQRFLARGFVPVGPVQTTYTVDGYQLGGQCVCPPGVNGPFAPTSEGPQTISYRQPGTPAPQNVQVPAGSEMNYQQGQVPAYPYPASLNK